MDGNRRYARSREIELGRGHALGFDRLREVSHFLPPAHFPPLSVLLARGKPRALLFS